MNFDLLHTPFFVAPSGGASGDFIPGILYPTGLDNKGQAIVKQPQQVHSGIAFTDLGSREILDYIYFDKDNQPIVPPTPIYGKFTNFWRDLGFDTIMTNIKQDGSFLTIDGGVELLSAQINVKYGVNITGTFLGNDVIIDKDVNWARPSQVETVTSLTTPIIANRTFDQVNNDEGYYLVDIV